MGRSTLWPRIMPRIPVEEKEVEYDHAEFGMVGLETAFPLYHRMVLQKGISLHRLISAMTIKPAEIIGIPKGTLKVGADADITVFDPKMVYKVDKTKFKSKSQNTPFDGWEVQGQNLLHHRSGQESPSPRSTCEGGRTGRRWDDGRVRCLLLHGEESSLSWRRLWSDEESRVARPCFNTGLSGYQEIFTDPSYLQQIVVMGAVQIGNTGVNFEDLESKSLYLSGVVAREYSHHPSSWRAKLTLDQYLKDAGVPGISDVDTREITQIIRDEGAQRSVIFSAAEAEKEDPLAYGKKLLNEVPEMEGLDLVSQASCKSPYEFSPETAKKEMGTVVVYDFGVKTNILRHFAQKISAPGSSRLIRLTQEVMAYKPSAVVLTNGPGDPATVPNSVQEISQLVGKVPILAICMGHQLLARALGGKTYKLKFGHHGTNHPVQDLQLKKILITSQNHGFAVKAESLKGDDLAISHINLNDHTVEGFLFRENEVVQRSVSPGIQTRPQRRRIHF